MKSEFINIVVNYFCSVFYWSCMCVVVCVIVCHCPPIVPPFFLFYWTLCVQQRSHQKYPENFGKAILRGTKVHSSSTKFLWLHRLLAQRRDVALRPWRSKCSGATDTVHLKGSEKPFRPVGIIWGEKNIKLKVMQFVSSSRRVHPSFSSLLPLFALIISCNLSTPCASLSLVLIFI